MGTADMFAAPFTQPSLALAVQNLHDSRNRHDRPDRGAVDGSPRFGLKQVLPNTRNSRKQRWCRY